ncbi:S-methyl-5-thioribose-1-phosphate isomerase [Sulfolobales archaeon HS-7]|nr:S-methyl-5-thioribose-1-phosphate isomerase [Sulfolobales archaeon HS-7]
MMVRKISEIEPIKWNNGEVVWLNVARLPWEEEYKHSSNYEDIARAIEVMEIRGAPAIGVAAAYGIAVAVYNYNGTTQELLEVANKASERLKRTRPTAVNLFWAVERMMNKGNYLYRDNVNPESFKSSLLEEAHKIKEEDIQNNKRMGEIGSSVIKDGDVILTHCNTGSLATAGFGTALGVIRSAWLQGKDIQVIATETRPLLQGARLTIWELWKDGIPSKLITDNMAGFLMQKGLISKVILGADRILRNGHVINKIGTYSLAVLAEHHGIEFYVAAPTSTIDIQTSLNDVIIESRKSEEVKNVMGKLTITVEEADAMNFAFDITPPELVTGIITEKGIAKYPFKELEKLKKTD